MQRPIIIAFASIISTACVPEGRSSDVVPPDRSRVPTNPNTPGDMTPPPNMTPPPGMTPPVAPPPMTPPPADIVLQAIDLSPAKPSIAYGATQQFTAAGRYSDGNQYAIEATITWRSSDDAMVTIDSTGLATGLAEGTATIYAVVEGIEGNTTISVGAPGVVSIAISPLAPSVNVGGTQQLTATVERADGSTEDVSASATWASSSPSVLTVSASGLATVLAEGSADVTAAHSGFSASTTLTARGCTYPSGNTDLRLGGVAPNLSWQGLYDETGAQLDFSLEAFHCDSAYDDYDTIAFVVGTGWCPNCPAYFRRVANTGQQLQAEGGLVVYLEAEDRSSQPGPNEYAQRHVDQMIGSSPGLRAGDGDTTPRMAINRSALVRFYPTAFVIRRSDMRIIADQGSANGTLDFVAIARNPEHDWSNGQLPPPFTSNCGPSDEEMYEPNDQYSQAAPIGAGTFQGGICADAPDFYRIDHAGSWTVDLDFRHATGDIDLYVWDPQSQAILRDGSNNKVGSNSDTDDERYSGNGPTTLRIEGYRSASAPYTLTLTTN